MQISKNQNRTYKDSVFVHIFAKCPQAKENFLSLYNALHGTNLKLEETSIEPVILEQTVYRGLYNDISMLVNGKIIVLVEQQSTINENMPLRFLEYIARLYEKLVPKDDRYKRKQVKLPKPEFYVFYNGKDNYDKEKILKLSNAFKFDNDRIESKKLPQENQNSLLELQVKVYNLNKCNGDDILKNCPQLYGYEKLVEYEREYKDQGFDDSLTLAINRCIKEGILADYLEKNSTEVKNMLIAEYDYDTDIRVQREEAKEEGIAQGLTQGIAQQKAEDEKLLAKTVAKLTAQKDAENARLNDRIAQLEALLAQK